jgi:hypothetical protein
MDWDEIIERNRGRILAAIAPLLAVLGFDPTTFTHLFLARLSRF